MNDSARNLTGNAIRYLGKLVLTLCLLICLFIPTPAFALDYNSEAKNYLTSVQNDLSSIKTIIQKLPNTSLESGQQTLDEVQAKLDDIESGSKKKALLFKDFSNNYQVSYQDKLTNISRLYNLQKEYNEKLSKLSTVSENVRRSFDDISWFLKEGFMVDVHDLSLSYGYNSVMEAYRFIEVSENLGEVDKAIQQYEQESRDLSKVIVLTDKVSVLASNLEKRINLAKQKANNIKEYVEVLKSFSDPDILGEIKDLDQYIGELTQNLPL